MKTSELLVLIFAFLVGYMLYKRCGCIEGIGGEDFYGKQLDTLKEEIDNEMRKCLQITGDCASGGFFTGPEPICTPGCDLEKTIDKLKNRVDMFTFACISEGQNSCD